MCYQAIPHCILNFPVFIAGTAAAETNNLHGTGHRTYRLEKPNAVTSGKWYFEMEVLTSGPMRIGWMEVSSQPGKELGSDDKSWAFDGFRVSISFLFFNSSHLRVSKKDNYFTLLLHKVKYLYLIVKRGQVLILIHGVKKWYLVVTLDQVLKFKVKDSYLFI